MDQGDGDETLRRRKRREDTERGKCPACLDQMTELADRGYTVYALDCGHIICGQCLQAIGRHTSVCVCVRVFGLCRPDRR